MIYTPVNDITAIDLTRHALIEASAGTGKTYTLENLVIRLLRERDDLAVENILIVTFTEKATSELKIRIQEKLAEVLAADETDPLPDGVPKTDDRLLARKLRGTLDNFDMAAIHTIHGFCHTVLQDFAFENQTLFQNDLIDDGALFDTLIMEQLRKTWPAVYGDGLKEALELSNFGANQDRFLSQVVAIARNVYRPGVGDLLQPDPQGLSFTQLRTAIIDQALIVKTLLGAPPAFSESYRRLNIHPNSIKPLLEKIVLPLEAYFTGFDETAASLQEVIAVIDQVQSAGPKDRKGVQSLLPEKWLKAGDNSEVCPNLADVIQALLDLADLINRLRYALAIEAVHRLQADASRIKNENGWISYDDMLSRLDTALHGPHSEDLIQRLRKRYKIAFVDEFQDTDPVQWRIFKRLFLDTDTPAPGNLLFLVGDPKQAIYAFRGADVYAYLEARNAMEKLAGQGKAALYSLATNWRSVPDLVTGFNTLFGRNEWFPEQAAAGAFDIGYQTVASPPVAQLPAFPAADDSGRPELNIIDLNDASSAVKGKPMLARFIAREIRCLITEANITIQDKDQTRRRLEFGDICLLVRGKPDVPFLEEALTERGIPYSFYKKPGLFFSDEALFVSLLCHAVYDPANMVEVKKALLTPFFNYHTNDLHCFETLPVSHPLKQLLFGWHDLAGQRRWGQLFQSMLEDSGLLFRLSETREWDRSYTNYRQIFEHLETIAYRDNLDFRGMSALLDGYRRQTVDARDEADIHQIETETRKVQIMTMHVSKGLQFPIVFVAGGLTQGWQEAYHVYHCFEPAAPEAGIRKEIDLSRTCQPDRHRQEKEDEDKRLYYVALTRAQFKLYVPFLPARSGQPYWGPVTRFVSQALAAAFPRDKAHPAVAWHVPDNGHGIDPDQKQASAADLLENDPTAGAPLLPDNADYRNRRILMESFSSIHSRLPHRTGQAATQYQTAPSSGREDDEGAIAYESPSPPGLLAEKELRGGADVGSMFHDIFEHIDYDRVVRDPGRILEHAETAGIITAAMAAYGIEEDWGGQVAAIVADTLTLPIKALSMPLILGQLKKADRLHEVEFHFPWDISDIAPAEIPECEAIRGRKCYIRGFIDLIFRHDGRYYIADWKSNRIEDGYDRPALEACMDSAGYHLQYRLYTIAVQRWLRQVLGAGFDPEVHFGGVFYFFIRGMNQTRGEKDGKGTGHEQGVYFVPGKEALAKIRTWSAGEFSEET